jgi:hypothetical protein
LGGCKGDALEGPLPFVEDRADEDAMIKLRAPGGGARGGGREEALDADAAADDDSRLGPDSIDEW